MGSREVQGFVPGKLEEADRDQTRGRRGCRSREAQETGPGGGSHGRPEAEPGSDGRQKEACSHGNLGGADRRTNTKIPPQARLRAQVAEASHNQTTSIFR